MSLKKFGVVLLSIFVIGAIAANSAFAKEEFEEGGSAWYTGASPGTRLPEGEANAKTVTGELSGEKATLETTIAGAGFDITWNVWDVTMGQIWNTHPAFFSATWFLFWSLRGFTVSSPKGCSVPSSELTTKRLKATVGMKKGSATIATVKFAPAEGTTLAILEVTGAECPVAGTYKLTGTIFGEMSNATATFGNTQPIKFSKAIQESAGTATSLKLGANAAFVTGTQNVDSETEFAVKKE